MKSRLINLLTIIGTVILCIILICIIILIIIILSSIFYKKDTSFIIPLSFLILMMIINIIFIKIFTCNIVIGIWNKDDNLVITKAFRKIRICEENVRLYNKRDILIIKECTGNNVTRRFILFKYYFKQQDVDNFIITNSSQICR